MRFTGKNPKFLFGPHLFKKKWIRNLLPLFRLRDEERNTSNQILNTFQQFLSTQGDFFNIKEIKNKREEFSLKQSTDSNLNIFNDKNQNYGYSTSTPTKSAFWMVTNNNISASAGSKYVNANIHFPGILLNERKNCKSEIMNYINIVIENIKLSNKYSNLFLLLFNINYDTRNTTYKEKILDSIDLLILECPDADHILNLISSLRRLDSRFNRNLHMKCLLYEVGSRLLENNSNLNVGFSDLRTIIYKTCIFSCEMYNKLFPNSGITEIKQRLDSYEKYKLDYNNMIKLKLKFYIGFAVSHLIGGFSKKNNHDFMQLLDDMVSIVSNDNNMGKYDEYKFYVEIIAILLSKMKLDTECVSKLILLISKMQPTNHNSELMCFILNNILKNECMIQSILENNCNVINEIVFRYLESDNNAQSIEIIRNIIENRALILHYFKNKTFINKFVDIIMNNIVKNVLDVDNLDFKCENEKLIESDLLLKLMDLDFSDKKQTFVFNYYFSTLNSLLNHIGETENQSIKVKKMMDPNNNTNNNFKYKLLKKHGNTLNKTNNLTCFKKINRLFLDFNDNKRQSRSVLSNLVNYFDLSTFIQKSIEYSLNNDIDWLLIYEGINLINNCISFNYENNIIANVEKLDNVLKLADKLVKKMRNSLDSIKLIENSKLKKVNIPNSRVYFEILRLIHNLNFVKKGSSEEIKLIPQGLIPLNTITIEKNGEDPDFLNSYVKDLFSNTFTDPLNGENFKSLNLIFIHGFLGSAFKSWNLEISKNKVSVITENHKHYFNSKDKKKQSNLDNVDDSRISVKNKRVLNFLENNNYLLWPKILFSNYSNAVIRLFAIDYSHSIFKNRVNSELTGGKNCNKTTLNDISEEIYDKLKKANIFSKEDNIIICHSMGGILLKMMVTNHPELTKKIKGIVFFGTPHFGTNIHSGIIDIFKKRLSPYIIELSSSFNINQLKKLNSRFQRIIYSIQKEKRPQIYSFSEYLPSRIPFLFNLSKVIVPYLNSNPFIVNS
ncbi:hypothetical protein FG386_002381 [Cryptosporidium ryanae]|uniref:uncharacterized protein n=1 Tax=Cryptosporidium ryanae TaxID=515981 RepID=UPI00351A196D|nr:hypothetical protein FG386_002381 [Cryptosporidium ryanae]